MFPPKHKPFPASQEGRDFFFFLGGLRAHSPSKHQSHPHAPKAHIHNKYIAKYILSGLVDLPIILFLYTTPPLGQVVMMDVVCDSEPITFLIKCNDGEGTFVHYPGKYAWRFITRLVDASSVEATERNIDLSEYISTKGLSLLQSIFGHPDIPVSHFLTPVKKANLSIWPADGLCRPSVRVLGPDLFECLPWSIVLDIRYSEQSTAHNMLEKDYPKYRNVLSCIPSDEYPLARAVTQQRYCAYPACETDFGEALSKVFLSISEYVPIAILQRIADDLECSGLVLTLPQHWVPLASVETMNVLQPFMHRNFANLVATQVATLVLTDPHLMTADVISGFHKAVYSFLHFKKSFRRVPELLQKHSAWPAMRQFIESLNDCKETDRPMKCDRLHHRRVVCDVGICCSFKTLQKIVQMI